MTPTHADMDILARTIWGEARGEGRLGMEAVASVILNRALDGRWPDTVAEVCLQPRQFSCWNKSDANRPQLSALTLADADFRQCYAISATALAGMIEDRTGEANHYCVSSIVPRVGWARGATETCRIGAHSFFRL